MEISAGLFLSGAALALLVVVILNELGVIRFGRNEKPGGSPDPSCRDALTTLENTVCRIEGKIVEAQKDLRWIRRYLQNGASCGRLESGVALDKPIISLANWRKDDDEKIS